jgi:hypothetical protein
MLMMTMIVLIGGGVNCGSGDYDDYGRGKRHDN